MESLARLVVLIFLSIYFLFLGIELIALVFAIKYIFPQYGGWWYCAWVPILIGANWCLTVLILIIMSKIGSKS